MQPGLARSSEEALTRAAAAIRRRLPVSNTFIKFIIVGGIAFLINQFLLYMLYDSPVFWFLPAQDTGVSLGLFRHPDIRLLISSVVAVEFAIVCQFNAHERWTFRHRGRRGWGPLRFLRFNLASAGSPIIVVVSINTLTPLLGFSPYLSNTIGILIGFMWNWTWNTLVIWPQKNEQSSSYESLTSG